MGYARQSLISLNDTPYYHVVARCVRRAWLWGFDEYADKDYSHRKAWVLERLQLLGTLFAVDLCAYAIMSNHYHLVVHVDRARARRLSSHEVVERWSQLFSVPALVERWRAGQTVEAERVIAEQLIEQWRARLCDVSWYMRCLNEHLARLANAEDRCTGRFWEGRFRSQALLDEAGLLTAMAYVDLNPIRAGIASTPEESAFTSVYERIRQMRRAPPTSRSPSQVTTPDPTGLVLLACRPSTRSSEPAIPVALHDYLQLVDWSGRQLRAGKRGAIDAHAPPILARLNIDPEAWQLAMHSGKCFGRALGALDHLRLHAKTLGQSWIRGLRRAEQLYRSV